MSKEAYHLVHANLAHARAPLDDPLMREFVENADAVDELGQNSPGFIDQPTLPDEGQCFSGMWMLNVSIWRSVKELAAFTYESDHTKFLDKRRLWFHKQSRASYVLFWAPVDEPVTEKEIKRRFDLLHQEGPTPLAFNFEERFSVEEMLAAKERRLDQP